MKSVEYARIWENLSNHFGKAISTLTSSTCSRQCNGCVIRASVSFFYDRLLLPEFSLSISLTTILKFCCPFRILISSIASQGFFDVFYLLLHHILLALHDILLYICRHYSTVDLLAFCMSAVDKILMLLSFSLHRLHSNCRRGTFKYTGLPKFGKSLTKIGLFWWISSTYFWQRGHNSFNSFKFR